MVNLKRDQQLYSSFRFILLKTITNDNNVQRKNAKPTAITDPSLTKLASIEHINAISNWMEPNRADAVPLLFVSANGVIANSVVVGNNIPIGKIYRNKTTSIA